MIPPTVPGYSEMRPWLPWLRLIFLVPILLIVGVVVFGR